jgi:hypothetical protein
MTWQKNRNFELLVGLAVGLIWMAGCGVKGDPLPPEKPPELGRGRPTYRSATKGLKIDGSPDGSADTSDRLPVTRPHQNEGEGSESDQE